jgi:hypothetical protein
MALPKAFDPHSTVSFLATFSVLSQRFDAVNLSGMMVKWSAVWS